MIRRDVIIIGLSPTCLRVAMWRGEGELLKVKCTPLEPGDWDQTWEKGLVPLDGQLRDAIKAIDIRPGTWARVVYSGPKAGAEVFNVPVAGATALRAAELSLRETLSDAAGAAPVVTHELHRDQPDETGGSGRTHVLAITDSADCSNAVAAWLSRAGLRVDGLIPVKAAALGLAVRAAASLPATGSHAVLWLGEHATALAGWHNGKLVFARAIDFGYWMLADGICRAVRARGGPGIDRLKAYSLLFATGIPQRGQLLDAALGVNAEGVLPLMQPVIQRYVVETRQTLRFGIPEADLPRTVLLLAGPGASIPELIRTLEPQFNVTVEKFDKSTEATPSGDLFVERGELPEVLTLNPSCFTLLPPSESARRVSKRLNAALVAGAAAAAIGLTALAGWTYARTASTIRELSVLEARTVAMTQYAAQRDQAEKLSVELIGALKTIRDNIGQRPRWMAGLAVISKACGDSIDLSHISGGFPHEAGGAPVLTLSGTAWPSRQPNAKTDSLGAFLDRVAGSPIVSAAKIVSTHADVNGGDAKTFVISLQLKAVAPDALLAAAAAPGRVQAGVAPGGSTAQAQESTP